MFSFVVTCYEIDKFKVVILLLNYDVDLLNLKVVGTIVYFLKTKNYFTGCGQSARRPNLEVTNE